MSTSSNDGKLYCVLIVIYNLVTWYISNMVYNVKNKIAIVTGSAKGFGKEFVTRLLNHEARVCVTDVNEVDGEETTKALKCQYGDQNVTFHK